MDGGVTKLTFTALFPFGGIAGGALGFQRANAALERLGIEASFKVLGGIDFDAGACEAFTSLTGAPCLCADVRELTSAQLIESFGAVAPDVVFFSPPCKGASGLISDEKAQTETYAAMNELALVWTRLMLATWACSRRRSPLRASRPRWCPPRSSASWGRRRPPRGWRSRCTSSSLERSLGLSDR